MIYNQTDIHQHSSDNPIILLTTSSLNVVNIVVKNIFNHPSLYSFHTKEVCWSLPNVFLSIIEDPMEVVFDIFPSSGLINFTNFVSIYMYCFSRYLNIFF